MGGWRKWSAVLMRPLVFNNSRPLVQGMRAHNRTEPVLIEDAEQFTLRLLA